MLLDLSGKTAVVTGASRGIGAATARMLAAEGVEVALLARSAPGLAEVALEITELGGKAIPVPIDLSNGEAIPAAIEDARRVLGHIDILVNNAGSSTFGAFDVLTDDDWRAGFDLKMMGYIRCMREVLPEMRERGSGRIVNIVGQGGRCASTDYTLGAFNAALLHVTKTLGDLVAADGVVVVAVNPGMTLTDRIGTPTPERLAKIPLGRGALPEEIARIVAVLCTEVAVLSSGTAFQADAGGAIGAF